MAGKTAHACNPNTWEGEAGRSDIQSPPQLHSEFEVSLSYMRPRLKKEKPKKKIRDHHTVNDSACPSLAVLSGS